MGRALAHPMHETGLMDARSSPSLALVLGGGAARGLAHIGVLEVLEREGIQAACVVGSSMGGLIAALHAAGADARELRAIARTFRFPRWFVPGAIVDWQSIFSGAARLLGERTFEGMARPLFVTATDLETGEPVLLEHGQVLPAVRATCAVPGVLLPERIEGRWLVDGGLVNLVPVDVAWAMDPDVVVAVRAGGYRARKLPQLDSPLTPFLARLGSAIPNPATAKMSFEILVRAAEIALDRATSLAAAMSGPEVLVEPDVKDIGLRDFHRLDDAIAAGRLAAERALPRIRAQLDGFGQAPRPSLGAAASPRLIDPVCKMMVSPARARARVQRDGRDYYFCSENCRDCFERDPRRYLQAAG
jgi:NTE family protein